MLGSSVVRHRAEPLSAAGQIPLTVDNRAAYEASIEADEQAEAEALASRSSWHDVGNALHEGRVRAGISKREAARRAGLSEGAWRHLEAGMKFVNRTRVEPNPRAENLLSAAQAVGVEPVWLFTLAGRDLPEGMAGAPAPSDLVRQLGELSSADRKLVEDLVRRLGRSQLPSPSAAAEGQETS